MKKQRQWQFCKHFMIYVVLSFTLTLHTISLYFSSEIGHSCYKSYKSVKNWKLSCANQHFPNVCFSVIWVLTNAFVSQFVYNWPAVFTLQLPPSLWKCNPKTQTYDIEKLNGVLAPGNRCWTDLSRGTRCVKAVSYSLSRQGNTPHKLSVLWQIKPGMEFSVSSVML